MDNQLEVELYIGGEPFDFTAHYHTHPRTGNISLFKLVRDSDGHEFNSANWESKLKEMARKQNNIDLMEA